MTVPGQELIKPFVRHVVRIVQVERDQVPGVALIGERAQHGVVETVQLAGAQEPQIGYPDQHVDQTLGGQIGAGYVQLLDRRFLPFHLHHVLADQICNRATGYRYRGTVGKPSLVIIFITRLIHQQTPEPFAPLEQRFHRGPGDFGTIVDGQTLQLYTVGTERVDVTVVHEVDPVQVDDSQIRGGRLQFVHVYHFVNLFLFLLDFLVRTWTTIICTIPATADPRTAATCLSNAVSPAR